MKKININDYFYVRLKCFNLEIFPKLRRGNIKIITFKKRKMISIFIEFIKNLRVTF